MRYGFALLLLLAGVAGAPAADRDRPLDEMSAEELSNQQERIEDRWLVLQQRRFEAAQRGDEAVAKRAGRKFTATGEERQAVLREIDRRAEDE